MEAALRRLPDALGIAAQRPPVMRSPTRFCDQAQRDPDFIVLQARIPQLSP